MQDITQTVAVAHKTTETKVWIGRCLSGIVVLFMLFDGVTKVAVDPHVVSAMTELGWPLGQTVSLGILVLACTAIYAIPRTSVLGAILLTAFLGGATAAKVRIEEASMWFSVAIGVLAWTGLYLRNARLRALVPVERNE
jgi:DoxX-like family